MLEHGGQLRAAAQHYGIAPELWLDLSTGINPVGYPAPPIPPDAWQRLPQDNDGLERAAAAYYGTPDLLPVAGSQAAIQALPGLRMPCRVGVLSPCYAEHAHAWKHAGHQVTEIEADHISEAIDTLDVLVLANPNNPTGTVFSSTQLQRWLAMLQARNGWLLVDEAFADAAPGNSVIAQHMPEGLVVLRSLGKFFGLAGARVGFVAAHGDLRRQVQELLGPWPISGPARHVARAALGDISWQQQTRQRLQRDSERLAQLLHAAGLQPAGGCALFQWVVSLDAATIQQQLARQGILVRRFDTPSSLRFGLPGTEPEWQRLQNALGQLT